MIGLCYCVLYPCVPQHSVICLSVCGIETFDSKIKHSVKFLLFEMLCGFTVTSVIVVYRLAICVIAALFSFSATIDEIC